MPAGEKNDILLSGSAAIRLRQSKERTDTMENADLSVNRTVSEECLLLDAWLDMAEAMLVSGAEVRRVEKTMTTLAASRNAVSVNAFTINSIINITCTFPDGSILTQSRRVISNTSTDLALLEQLNALSRRACLENMSPEELKKGIRTLREQASNLWYYPGAFLGAAAFALFFGSTLPEALVSGLAGLLTGFLSRKIGRYVPNAVFSNFFVSLLVGILIHLLCGLVPALSPAKIIIGDIMLLTPGLVITHSIRDIIIGDTISGLTRFVESILWAGALAVGFITAMLLAGGVR